MDLLHDTPTAGPQHAQDRRSPLHPLRRVKDYRPDGSRTRTWSAPERTYRLTYRRRPILTLASTVVALLLPTTLVYAGTTYESTDASQATVSLFSGPKSPTIPVGSVVTVGKRGYALASTTIAPGQGITLYNTDVAEHVADVAPTDGTSCAGTPLVIPAGEYQSCTFATEGSYTISDPANPSAAPLTVTVVPDSGVLSRVGLVVDHSTVARGGSVTFLGSVNVIQAGIQIDIIAQESAGGAYRKVGEVRTTDTGSFTFTTKPSTTTVYFANAISAGMFATSAKTTVTALKAQKAAKPQTRA